MSSENNHTYSYDNNQLKHEYISWRQTPSIITKINDSYVTIIKSEGVSSQELFYPKDVRLTGDFEIQLEIKSEHGKYITFMLNNKASYGGSVFGWRNVTNWTKIRIIRTNDKIEVFYADSKKPQVTRQNGDENLYFFFRINGLKDEIKLHYRNLKIVNNGRLIFKDCYLLDDMEYLLEKVDLMGKKVELYEKMLESNTALFNNILLHYDLKPKSVVQNSHTLYKELISLFENICNKYGLKFWIDYGSLLGAVRHGGFIPWDDDVDVGMTRNDYDKLLEVLEDELKSQKLEEDINVQTNSMVKGNRFPFTKFNLSYKNVLLGFIDIFPYDFTEDKETTKYDFVKAKQNAYALMNDGMDREVVTEKILEELNFTRNEKEYMCMGYEGPANYFSVLDTDTIFPLSSINIEEKKFPCPNKPEYYLSIIYGKNYMKIPGVIYDHGFHHRLFTTENIDELFEYEINKLKGVNRKYNR